MPDGEGSLFPDALDQIDWGLLDQKLQLLPASQPDSSALAVPPGYVEPLFNLPPLPAEEWCIPHGQPSSNLPGWAAEAAQTGSSDVQAFLPEGRLEADGEMSVAYNSNTAGNAI